MSRNLNRPSRSCACWIALWLLPSLAASAQTDTASESESPVPVHVLTIGNSFTRNATRHLDELATAAGCDLVHESVIIGGSLVIASVRRVGSCSLPPRRVTDLIEPILSTTPAAVRPTHDGRVVRAAATAIVFPDPPTGGFPMGRHGLPAIAFKDAFRLSLFVRDCSDDSTTDSAGCGFVDDCDRGMRRGV